jgi:hypothetical protein
MAEVVVSDLAMQVPSMPEVSAWVDTARKP